MAFIRIKMFLAKLKNRYCRRPRIPMQMNSRTWIGFYKLISSYKINLQTMLARIIAWTTNEVWRWECTVNTAPKCWRRKRREKVLKNKQPGLCLLPVLCSLITKNWLLPIHRECSYSWRVFLIFRSLFDFKIVLFSFSALIFIFICATDLLPLRQHLLCALQYEIFK